MAPTGALCKGITNHGLAFAERACQSNKHLPRVNGVETDIARCRKCGPFRRLLCRETLSSQHAEKRTCDGSSAIVPSSASFSKAWDFNHFR